MDIRAVLFADFPLEDWKPRDGVSDDEPWASFERARACLAAGDIGGAMDALDPITQRTDIESRQVLQAWSCLRAIGVKPIPRDAKLLYGIVFEVPVDGGLDILAAYADYSARYVNHAGNAIVWDTREATMDSRIDELMRAGETLVTTIAPWEGERPEAPEGERVRLSMLTPSGVHFKEGTFSVLDADPLAGPAVTAGTALLQALVERDE